MGKNKKKIQFEKVVVNIGVGRLRQQNASFDEKVLPEIMKEVALITGQHPSTRPAKKSIAGFKMREGDILGIKVTLRGKRMTDFINKVIKIVLPRVRDFAGLGENSIDKQGNLNFGFKEQFVFPEIIPEKSKVNFGLQISVKITAKTAEEAAEFYKSYGLPLKV